MKAVVAAFNQDKALVGAFSVITNLRMELFEALIATINWARCVDHTFSFCHAMDVLKKVKRVIIGRNRMT